MYFELKLKIFIVFSVSRGSSCPCRLWLLQYRKPSSSIQTCRWPRRSSLGKPNHPLRIDMAPHRYSRCRGSDWRLCLERLWLWLVSSSVSFLLEQECPRVDQRCQYLSWRRHPHHPYYIRWLSAGLRTEIRLYNGEMDLLKLSDLKHFLSFCSKEPVIVKLQKCCMIHALQTMIFLQTRPTKYKNMMNI